MKHVTRRLMEARAARTPLSKALALNRAIDALAKEIGVSPNGLQKAAGMAGAMSSMQTDIDRLKSQISGIQARNRHAASRQPATQPFILRNRP